MNALRPLLVALQFLTILPVRLADPPTDRELGASVLFHPVVGLLLGGLLAGVAFGAQRLGASASLTAALVLAAWALLTGGLHLDGLADTADAWVGGRGDRERTLAIMKDPRAGPMAVIALVVVLLLKFASIEALAGTDVAHLVLAPVLARACLPMLLLTTPYVRPNGLGAGMAASLPGPAAAIVCAASLAVCAAWLGARSLAPLLAAAAVFLLVRRTLVRRLGGTTGDTAGALVEFVETASLVSMALAWRT